MSVQIIGALTERVLPSRIEPISAIVAHTTGSTDLAKILEFYRAPDGLCPHYVIAADGTIYRIAWESQVAWHAKIDPKEAQLYAQGYNEWSHWHWLLETDAPKDVGQEYSGYHSWRTKWLDGKGKQSPLDLITGKSPNHVSVGIELQANEKPGYFTDVQYDRLAALVVDISQRNNIKLNADTLLGHQDVSPMRRTNAAGGWDPGESFDWQRIWYLILL